MLRECSDCLEIINNAGMSLGRLLRVQGKERMLSQVSNKSISPIFETIELSRRGPCCNSTLIEDSKSLAPDVNCTVWLWLAVKEGNRQYPTHVLSL